MLSRLILGTRHSYMVYLSLVPIVSGVALASFTEANFDFIGLISALCATGGFATSAIFSKQVLRETGMHHLYLLYKLGQMAALLFLPVWLVVDGSRIYSQVDMKIMVMLVANGSLHWLQNILAFTLYQMVCPLSYSVANVTKRIAVIWVSILLLKNPVTLLNISGMVIAVLGVFFYGRVKQQELLMSSQQLEKLNNNDTSKDKNGYHRHNYEGMINGRRTLAN